MQHAKPFCRAQGPSRLQSYKFITYSKIIKYTIMDQKGGYTIFGYTMFNR